MKSILKFLHEARTELMKVSWPSRQTAINLTLTVLLITAISAAFIGGVDLLFTQGIKLLTTYETSSSNGQVTATPVDIEATDIETTPIN